METVKTFFDEGKHLNEEGVALFVDALKLDTVEQLPGAVRDHAADCPECKKEITGLFALLDGVDYSDVRSHPSFNIARGKGSRVPLLMKLAAVVAGAAILATITYYLGPFRQGETSTQAPQSLLGRGADSAGTAQSAGTQSTPAAKEVFAGDFTADPDLEDLVNGRSRSAALSVTSPTNGSVLQPDEVFSWKGEGKKSLTLRIMNNKGGTVLTEIAPPSRFVLKQRLSPGLYYWKIETESELLYVGKFFVK